MGSGGGGAASRLRHVSEMRGQFRSAAARQASAPAGGTRRQSGAARVTRLPFLGPAVDRTARDVRHSPPRLPGASPHLADGTSPVATSRQSEAERTLSVVGSDQSQGQDHNPRPRRVADASQAVTPFNWARQWYPVAVASHLHPGRPHAVSLLGRDLVLWRRGDGAWACFEDACPHRLAPLSEGRLETREGGGVSLQCSYHGWRFGGDGGCEEIPTSTREAERAACRARAKAFRVKVAQDLVWVWGDDGPSAYIDSVLTEPSTVDQLEDGGFIGIAPYVRDVAYGYDTLVENVLDPSHLPFAHHKLQFDRNMACPIPTVIHPGSASMHGFTADVKAYGFDWTITFKPPVLVMHDYGRFCLLTYCVPTRPGESRIIMRFCFRKSLGALAMAALPVVHHLLANAVMDSDMYILHVQGRNLRKVERCGSRWEEGYYMPTPSDREIVEFRRWLHGPAGGQGPEGPDGTPLSTVEKEASRRHAMDRYEHHTKHCAVCRRALQWVEALQCISKWSAVALTFALGVIAKGGARQLLKRPAVGAVLGLVALTLLHFASNKLASKFRYTDYVHWNK